MKEVGGGCRRDVETAISISIIKAILTRRVKEPTVERWK